MAEQQAHQQPPSHEQMHQLLRRFRSKRDLYKYLNESLVSLTVRQMEILESEFIMSLCLANLPAEREELQPGLHAGHPT